LALPAPWWFLVDLRSRFGRRVQLLQVYRPGSTRSVFINIHVSLFEKYMSIKRVFNIKRVATSELIHPYSFYGASVNVNVDLFVPLHRRFSNWFIRPGLYNVSFSLNYIIVNHTFVSFQLLYGLFLFL